jgi:hypothetical protein
VPANASPLAQYTVLVYNTSVAASEQVADYYRQLRGIPTANKIGFAMGTGDYWAWRADWHATVLTPLYSKVMAVGAKAVLTVAGCPHIAVVSGVDAGAANAYVLLDTFLAAVKPLYCGGGEPCAKNNGNGVDLYPALRGQISYASDRDSPRAFNPETLLPQAATAVAIGSSTVQPHTSTVSGAWQGEWDQRAFLLRGIVGYVTYPDTSHPVDLYDKSKAILDRAAANEYSLVEARKQKVLVGMDYTATGSDGTIHDALTVSLLLENGFENVVYWNEHGLGKPGTDCLAPAPETFGGSTTADAFQQILDGNAPTQDPWLMFGIGFENGVAVVGSDPEFTQTNQDNWMAFLGLQNKGVCFVGASYGSRWSTLVQRNGGIGGNGSPSDFAHAGSVYIVRGASIFLSLLQGMSLCEAEVAQYEDSYGTSGGVYGDPLMRPIIVGRTVAPSVSVGGTLPTGLNLGAPLTDVVAGSMVESNTVTLTGFTGRALLVAGSRYGTCTPVVNGTSAPAYRWVQAGDTVKLRYTAPYIASHAATVELRLNGVLAGSLSVAVAATPLAPTFGYRNHNSGVFFSIYGARFGTTPATLTFGNADTLAGSTVTYAVPRLSNTDTDFIGQNWVLDPPDIPPLGMAYAFLTNSTTGLTSPQPALTYGMSAPPVCTGAFTNQPAVAIGATNLVSATNITYPAGGGYPPTLVEVENANTEFRVNGGAWRSTPVGILPGSVVGIRLLAASGSGSTAESAQITVGANTYTFTCTTVAASGSTLTHGASYVLSGLGSIFGTKTVNGSTVNAPLFHWNGDGTTPTFDYTQGASQSIQNSGWRASTPHARLARYLVGKRANADAVPYNNVRSVSYPVVAMPQEVYASFLVRLDASWDDTAHGGGLGEDDHQMKPCSFQWHGGDYMDSPYLYHGIDGIRATGDMATPSEVGDGEWQYSDTLPATLSGLQAANPRAGWVRVEYVARHASDGFLRLFETTAIAGLGRREVLNDDGDERFSAGALPADGEAAFHFGGYIRDWDTGYNWVYHTDLFLDVGSSTRVVLGNANTLAACTMLEPQPYTAWSASSVTLKGNCGGLTTGSTGYLYVLTGAGTTLAGPIAVTIA